MEDMPRSHAFPFIVSAAARSAAVRRSENPLLTTRDVKPTHKDFRVDGIFNCGAAKYNGEYILLCRVADEERHGPGWNLPQG